MFSIELFVVTALKAVVEIAGMALLSQGAIGLLAGKARQDNFVYRMLQIVTAPVLKMTRTIVPRFVADRYLGLLGFFLLFWLWAALIYAKGYVCHSQGLTCIPG